MSIHRTIRLVAIATVVLSLPAVISNSAQTPNTGAMVITVLDQNDAVVPGATVSVVNTATGAVRDVVTGESSVTLAALPITGTYKVTVSKSGFSPGEVTGLILRSGETAEVKIKLNVIGVKNVVEIYGTEEGIRSDPQIGRSFTSRTLDETPILGRKLTTVPLLNSAFRQGKGTGDLFVNQAYFITGVGSRRATTFTLDGASNDEGWGRQTAIATVPLSAVQEINVLSNAFSSEYGWTSGSALNIVTKAGTNALHGEALYM